MLPHQFKRLLETMRITAESLRFELSEIKHATKEQERAIRDTSQAASGKDGEIPRVIADVASAIEASNKDVPAYEKTQRHKEYGLQQGFLLPAWITAVATVLAFAAAGIYAYIANLQLNKMNETYKQIRMQTYISCLNAQAAHQALIDSEAMEGDSHSAAVTAAYQGILSVRESAANLSIQFGDPVFERGEVQVAGLIQNSGKTAALGLSSISRVEILPTPKDPTFTYPKDLSSTQSTSKLDAGITIPEDPKKNPWMIPALISKGNPVKFTTSDMNAFTGGRTMIYTYGRATYRDIFGVHHWAQTCVMPEFLPEGEIGDLGNKKCVEYNKSDGVSVIPRPNRTPRTPAELPTMPCVKPPDN